jgi:ribonucleotide monophosphatase NagD (HAD superfamily)
MATETGHSDLAVNNRPLQTMAEKDDYLLGQLIEMGLVTNQSIESRRTHAEKIGSGIVDLLVQEGIVTPQHVAQAKAMHFGVELIDLKNIRITKKVLATMTTERARALRMIPLEVRKGTKPGVFFPGRRPKCPLVVAIDDPSDLDTIDSAHHLLQRELVIRSATPSDIDWALEHYYPKAG